MTILHEIARRRAQEGMDRALDRAEAKTPSWGDMAVKFIEAYALKHREFAGWMVVKASRSDPNFLQPENEKAWGAPFKRAAAEGFIPQIPGRTAKDPYRHGNPVPVWGSLIYGRPE